MKIVAISDTHGSDFIDKVPECDILLIAGDISPVRLDHTFYAQQQWFHGTFIPQLKKLKGVAKNIVFIGGNHDTFLSEINITDGHSNHINSYLPESVHYLCDEFVEINGIKIYGTPWCSLPKWARSGPPVWNFAADEKKLEQIYSAIPNDIDILLTHGPAKKYCDTILEYNETENLGSSVLANKILKKKPKFVLSGHIHSANHNIEKMIGPDINTPLDISLRCVSLLDESYSLHYEPYVFYI